MRILHISFHKGCQNDIEYICNYLGYTLEFMIFDDGVTKGNALYNIGQKRAQDCWEKYKDYFNSFNIIITSDTTPISRVFLQNNYKNKLIIWISNRFDYSDGASLDCNFPDKDYYELIKSIPFRPNVIFISNCAFENLYLNLKQINISNLIVKPIGCISNIYTNTIYTKLENKNNYFWIPQYHNETILLNLSNKLNSLNILNYNGRHGGLNDLGEFKGIIHIPYAWSTISFFEAIQLGMIYFIPSLDFLIELSKIGNFWFQPPFKKELLYLSEWYNEENNSLFVYFNSWADLKKKTETINFIEMKKNILIFAENHKTKYLYIWKKLLDSV